MGLVAWFDFEVSSEIFGATAGADCHPPRISRQVIGQDVTIFREPDALNLDVGITGKSGAFTADNIDFGIFIGKYSASPSPKVTGLASI